MTTTVLSLSGILPQHPQFWPKHSFEEKSSVLLRCHSCLWRERLGQASPQLTKPTVLGTKPTMAKKKSQNCLRLTLLHLKLPAVACCLCDMNHTHIAYIYIFVYWCILMYIVSFRSYRKHFQLLSSAKRILKRIETEYILNILTFKDEKQIKPTQTLAGSVCIDVHLAHPISAVLEQEPKGHSGRHFIAFIFITWVNDQGGFKIFK